VVSGNLREQNSSETLKKGDNVILPYAGGFVFAAEDAAMLLLTENFS
jgi:hypothetical protein